MKRLACITVLLFLSFAFVFTTTSAEDYNEIRFSDADTLKEFTARIFAESIEIYEEDNRLADFSLDNIISCSASKRIIYLYESDSPNKQLCIYRYNTSENIMDSIFVNRDALCDKLCFASDSHDNIYFVSNYKVSCLCIYSISDNTLNEFELNSRIRQIINIGDNKILIITDNALYINENGVCEKISGSSLSFPVILEYNQTITDADGNVHSFDNTENTETSVAEYPIYEADETKAFGSSNTVAKAAEDDIAFEMINENTFAVPKGTTYIKIKTAFASSGVILITKADGSVIKEGKVGTGTKVSLENGEEISLVIFGELTGEGNINSRDIKALLSHLCDKESLSEPFYSAADLNSDGRITTKDALLLLRLRD